jgi:hypothetical protein
MTSLNDVDGNVADDAPHTWVSLAHYADMQKAIERADSFADAETKRAERYRVVLMRISALCDCADTSRGYIGNIARDALNPIAAKPGQEGAK